MPATINLPTTYYTERTIGTGEVFAPGFYTDHSDTLVAEAAFNLRAEDVTRSWMDIADTLGLQCWQHASMAAGAHARRAGVEMPRRYRRVASSNRSAGRWLLDRRFGVELECGRGTMQNRPEDRLASYHPVHTAAEHMRREGIDAQPEAYNHTTPNHWKITYDVTVTGVEAVSPILRGDAGFESLRAATRGLKAAGATAAGGVHVHHDVTDLDHTALGLLIDNLENVQSAMMAYLPRSRRRSSWCRPVSATEFNTMRRYHSDGRYFINNSGRRQWASGFASIDRYRFFNFQPTGCYGTVEFRGHGPSLNPMKLRNWIAVGQAIIEATRQGKRFDTAQTPESMTDLLVEWDILPRNIADKFVAVCNSR